MKLKTLGILLAIFAIASAFQNCSGVGFGNDGANNLAASVPTCAGANCPTTCSGTTCSTPITPDSCLLAIAPVQNGAPPASGAGITSVDCPSGYSLFSVVTANCAVGSTGANLEHFGRLNASSSNQFYLACDMGNDALYDGGVAKILCKKDSCANSTSDFYTKKTSVGVTQSSNVNSFVILNENITQPTSASCNGNDILLGVLSVGCAGDDLAVVGSIHSITSFGNTMQISCDGNQYYFENVGFAASQAYNVYGGGLEVSCLSASSPYASRIYSRQASGTGVVQASCDTGDSVIGILTAWMMSNQRFFVEDFESNSAGATSVSGLPSIFNGFQKEVGITCLRN